MKRKMYQGLPSWNLPRGVFDVDWRKVVWPCRNEQVFYGGNSCHCRSLQEIEVVRVSFSPLPHYQVVMNAGVRLTSAIGVGIYQRNVYQQVGRTQFTQPVWWTRWIPSPLCFDVFHHTLYERLTWGSCKNIPETGLCFPKSAPCCYQPF